MVEDAAIQECWLPAGIASNKLDDLITAALAAGGKTMSQPYCVSEITATHPYGARESDRKRSAKWKIGQ
jgi:hypothetical protein